MKLVVWIACGVIALVLPWVVLYVRRAVFLSRQAIARRLAAEHRQWLWQANEVAEARRDWSHLNERRARDKARLERRLSYHGISIDEYPHLRDGQPPRFSWGEACVMVVIGLPTVLLAVP